MLTALTLATLFHISVVDWKTHMIENAAALMLFAIAMMTTPQWWMWGLLGFGLFAVPSLAKLVGFGDAKLMLGIGTLVGPDILLLLTITFVAQYAFQRVGSRSAEGSRYPFAPALCGSTAALVLIV
jgi:prepilin signal peptidase PulO-like enzyme (type II secretory pathway)